MIFFIDESGHPHPQDPVPCPVLGAVGIPASESRRLMSVIFRLKQDLLGLTDPITQERQYKAAAIVNERTQRRVPAKWRYAEALVAAAASLPVVSFFIVMERPATPQPLSASHLPCYVRFLLERINQYMLATRPDRIAPVVFDSRSTGADSLWSQAIGSFLYRHGQGRLWRNIVETPFFVDSALTPGVQVADLFVSIVRQHYEIQQHGRAVPAAYSLAMERMYRSVRTTVPDLAVPGEDGAAPGVLYGEYRMPARYWEWESN